MLEPRVYSLAWEWISGEDIVAVADVHGQLGDGSHTQEKHEQYNSEGFGTH